jgi:hypothetical protein
MDVCAEQCDETCLMTAAGEGNLDVVEYLCEFGGEKLIMLQNKVSSSLYFFSSMQNGYCLDEKPCNIVCST